MGSNIKSKLLQLKVFIGQTHVKLKTLSLPFKPTHNLDDEIRLSLILILKECMIPYQSHIRQLTDLWVLRELIILYKRPIKRLNSRINLVRSIIIPFKIFHLFLSIKWKAWGSNYPPFIARAVMWTFCNSIHEIEQVTLIIL